MDNKLMALLVVIMLIGGIYAIVQLNVLDVSIFGAYAQRDSTWDTETGIGVQVRGGGSTTNCPNQYVSLGTWLPSGTDATGCTIIDTFGGGVGINCEVKSSGCSTPPCLKVIWANVDACKYDTGSGAYLRAEYGEVPYVCDAGQWMCEDNIYYECSNNQWVLIQDCDTVDGSCQGATPHCYVCADGQKKLEGDAYYECSSNSWLYICTEGQKKCEGQKYSECEAQEMKGWVLKETCGANQECKLAIPHCVDIEEEEETTITDEDETTITDEDQTITDEGEEETEETTTTEETTIEEPSWFEQNQVLLIGISIFGAVLSLYLLSEYRKGNLKWPF